MMATLWRGTHAGALQAGRHGGRGVGELAVADRLLGVVAQHDDLRLLRVRRQMPVEHLEQRRGLGRLAGLVAAAAGRRGGERADPWRGRRHRRQDRRAAACPALLHRAQQVGHGLGALQRLGRQVDAEGALGAQQQFHARQAVEAEVLVEHAGQRDRRQVDGTGVQVAQGGLDDRQQRAGLGFRRGPGCRRCERCWGRHGCFREGRAAASGRTSTACIMPVRSPQWAPRRSSA